MSPPSTFAFSYWRTRSFLHGTGLGLDVSPAWSWRAYRHADCTVGLTPENNLAW
jgi:hypothetical protein